MNIVNRALAFCRQPMLAGGLLMVALLALALPVPTNAQASAPTSPEQLIRSASQEILDQIKADPSLQSGDIERLNRLVDQQVMPHVNFQRMTALAVGRNWRSASPEQQTILMAEFRRLLLLTYADAVRQVSDTKIVVRPSRAKPTDDDVIVRTQVLRSGQEPVQLDYRLEKTSAGWRIYDLNILGLWLIENYRNQFAQVVSANGIDGLIRDLRDKNKRLTASVSARRAGD